MRVRLAAVDAGAAELDAIARVFASGALTNGPETAAFEQEFAARHGCAHGVALANGTVALAGLYLALGVGPGDEVVVPSLTFISTATSVLHVGATPVFADVDPETLNLDPADVARKASPRTKAVVAVHYGGQPADMDELHASAPGAVVLEDAAEAHGTSYRGRPTGSLARAAMFSFTPTKNITTGEGGMVTTDDAELAQRLRLLRNHGQTALYEHAALGFNWRLSEMQAAMGRVQLGKLDTVLARKQENAAYLAQRWAEVEGVRPPVCRPDRTHAYMLYTLLFDEAAGRDAAADALAQAGIEARVYFPPAHRQPVFGGHDADVPVTDDVARRILSVPFHARLTQAELDEIVDVVDKALAPWR